jgi:hypothetical protein
VGFNYICISQCSFLYDGYQVFSRGKVRLVRAADHSPPSSAEVLEEQNYTSTPPWATTGLVMGLLYLFDVDMSYTRVLHIKVAYRVPQMTSRLLEANLLARSSRFCRQGLWRLCVRSGIWQ